MDDSLKVVNKTIVKCCVLHNICIDFGDIWDEMIVDDTPFSNEWQRDNVEDEELRDFLKKHISVLTC